MTSVLPAAGLCSQAAPHPSPAHLAMAELRQELLVRPRPGEAGLAGVHPRLEESLCGSLWASHAACSVPLVFPQTADLTVNNTDEFHRKNGRLWIELSDSQSSFHSQSSPEALQKSKRFSCSSHEQGSRELAACTTFRTTAVHNRKRISHMRLPETQSRGAPGSRSRAVCPNFCARHGGSACMPTPRPGRRPLNTARRDPWVSKGQI